MRFGSLRPGNYSIKRFGEAQYENVTVTIGQNTQKRSKLIRTTSTSVGISVSISVDRNAVKQYHGARSNCCPGILIYGPSPGGSQNSSQSEPASVGRPQAKMSLISGLEVAAGLER